MKSYEYEENWITKIQNLAGSMSMEWQKSFQKYIGQSKEALPPLTIKKEIQDENAMRMVSTFVDYAVSTSIGLAIKYISHEKEFEQMVIGGIKNQFKQARRENGSSAQD